MRGRSVISLGLVWLGLAGCHAPDPPLKPTLREEYILPPGDDSRFSLPPTFPKETLDSGSPKKDWNKQNEPLRGPNAGRFGTGAMGSGY